MSIFIKFAKKYFEESLKDLERAERALSINDYPQAIFYTQQCIEKGVKAMLEVKKRIVYNHGPELVTIFSEVFENEWNDDFLKIVDALEYLSEYYTRARYPMLLKGEVLGPADIVSKDIASKGIEKAKEAIEVIKNFLRRNSII
jgi:HEPN domain-containing protein